MHTNTIAGIVLSCVFAIVLVMYFVSLRFLSNDVIIFILALIQVVSLFFLFFTSRSEGFFFEVSPERKKCLVEQVSQNTDRRSCNCCQKGTVGGYPPLYKDWLTPTGKNELWKRTDNWTTNPDSTAYIEQSPATELIDGN